VLLKRVPYLLIGLAVVGLLAARIVLASSPSDFPQEGDKFALVYADKEFPKDGYIVGINLKSLRQEADGSRSVVYYMRVGTAQQIKISDAVAVGMGGRVAVLCNSDQYRFEERHVLDMHNNNLKTMPPVEAYKGINPDDEAMTNLHTLVCNTDLPITAKKGSTTL
jgi:hypothetical protein